MRQIDDLIRSMYKQATSRGGGYDPLYDTPPEVGARCVAVVLYNEGSAAATIFGHGVRVANKVPPELTLGMGLAHKAGKSVGCMVLDTGERCHSGEYNYLLSEGGWNRWVRKTGATVTCWDLGAMRQRLKDGSPGAVVRQGQ